MNDKIKEAIALNQLAVALYPSPTPENITLLERSIRYADLSLFTPQPTTTIEHLQNELFTTKALCYFKRKEINRNVPYDFAQINYLHRIEDECRKRVTRHLQIERGRISLSEVVAHYTGRGSARRYFSGSTTPPDVTVKVRCNETPLSWGKYERIPKAKTIMGGQCRWGGHHFVFGVDPYDRNPKYDSSKINRHFLDEFGQWEAPKYDLVMSSGMLWNALQYQKTESKLKVYDHVRIARVICDFMGEESVTNAVDYIHEWNALMPVLKKLDHLSEDGLVQHTDRYTELCDRLDDEVTRHYKITDDLLLLVEEFILWYNSFKKFSNTATGKKL